MAPPILWQNEERTITLLDIPQSISAAQGTNEHPCHDLLISTKPQEHPFPPQEPKTEKASANLNNNTVDSALDAEYHEILHSALEEVRKQYDDIWCLPRRTASTSDSTGVGKKRKLDHSSVNQNLDSNTQNYTFSSPHKDQVSVPPNHAPSESTDYEVCCNEDDRFQTTCAAKSVDISASHSQNKRSAFHMPPHSSFYLGDLSSSQRAFHAAIRNQADSHQTRKHFDFVLMDPPWPNRSVKRSTHFKTGSGYSTAHSLQAIEHLILGTDLDMLMADKCLVGVWITNRQSLRELVLAEDGIFDQWGLVLEEEWIWLKTTVKGEPVSDIDSLWRKPYEVLLLARKQRRGSVVTRQTCQSAPKRRVIMAVPDLHSRKPCLKGLIEPLLTQQKDYRALEVFARHLVAGWWSWGDECTKFNCESHWQRAHDAPNGPHPG
ncbi:hypothetical protein MYCGRDRAFT_75907 [Lecanosticta acicola]|uniref:MT-A70-domain-containing protein n=1 Tax=Lecanosticta acicola TaxID=111012 RepID=A0AAI8YVN4_9PEZI|nr:hypothetical protein MYCGRDRAFT_75907 [Lecanosticta acicola]